MPLYYRTVDKQTPPQPIWLPVTEGKIRFKRPAWEQDNNTWFVPNKVLVRVTDPVPVGAPPGTIEGPNPRWVDVGYKGYPNPPQSIWVNSWDFVGINIGFTGAAAGGAAVSTYEVMQTDANGGNTVSKFSTTSPSPNFSVSMDTRYQFFVRSLTAAGLASAWVGPVKVEIGHSELSHTVTDVTTPYWDGARTGDTSRYQNQVMGVVVPSDCVVQSMGWVNLRTFDGHAVSAYQVIPWGWRTVSIWSFGDSGIQIQNLSAGGSYPMVGTPKDVNGAIQSSSTHTVSGFAHQGNGSAQFGIVPQGSGWSNWADPSFMLYGDVWVSGYRIVYTNRTVIDRAYKGNGYW